MSKLIEANEVKDSLLTELLMGVDGGTDDSYLKTYEVIDRIEKIVNEWVDNAPTVKAIPIEWLKYHVMGRKDLTFDKLELIWSMIRNWEKENEQRY